VEGAGTGRIIWYQSTRLTAGSPAVIGNDARLSRSLESLQGLVYPDFARCVVPGPAPSTGKRVGGIDFGDRNPFAAVWGIVDAKNVLWLTGEHYSREESLHFHRNHLPR
jgi:hypothetical protein